MSRIGLELDGNQGEWVDLVLFEVYDQSLLTDQPEAVATLHAPDGDITIGKVPFLSASTAAPAIPEEVSLFAKVLGALIVAWGVVRYTLVTIAGLVAQSPLKNSRRREIYEVLKRSGFAHVRELQRVTGIPLGSLAYHLKILTQGKNIMSVRRRDHLVYFVPSREFTYDEAYHLSVLVDPSRRRLSEVLAEGHPRSQQCLSEVMGLSRGQISKHLRILEEEGLVERKGDWKSEYRPTELLLRWWRLVGSVSAGPGADLAHPPAPNEGAERPKRSTTSGNGCDPAAGRA